VADWLWLFKALESNSFITFGGIILPNCNITMDINETQKKLKEIENLDTNTLSVSDIIEIINPLLTGISFGTPLIDNNGSFYRAVKLDKKPEIFDDIIYPPTKYVTSFQRLNEPGCPVFYCSNSNHICVFEGRYKNGDVVTISEWEVIEGKKLVTTNIGYTEHLKTWSKREVPVWETKHDPLKGKTAEEIEKNKLILDFLSKIFCQNFDDENNKYKLSIAISNILGFNTESKNVFEKIGEQKYRAGKDPMEGIIYPSIIAEAKADNLAIRRFSFHEKMKFVCADYIRVIEVNENIFKFEELDFSNEIDADKKIIWKGRRGNILVPKDSPVKIIKTDENEFTASRIDGGKLYRD